MFRLVALAILLLFGNQEPLSSTIDFSHHKLKLFYTMNSNDTFLLFCL